MGVKFVSPKKGDAVAVVARSVESQEDEVLDELEEGGDAATAAAVEADATIEPEVADESPTDAGTDTED